MVADDDTTKRADGSGASGYLSSAPRALTERYEQRENIQWRRELLGRLLTAQQMHRSWTVLNRHIASSRQQWERLWQEIVYARHSALLDSERHPPNERARTERKKQLLAIVRNANDLAAALDEGPLDVRALDVRAYELFPHDVMENLGVTNWSELKRIQRENVAWELLEDWPTATDLLRELAALAARRADEVMARGSVMRTTRDRDARCFASALCTYFRATCSMPLSGTVANIASVTFGRHIDKSIVQRADKAARKNR